MFCQKCGNQTVDNSSFCPKCGYKFGEPISTQSQPQIIYVNQQSPSNKYYTSKKEPILSGTEKAFIIIIGIITLLNGAISILSLINGNDKLSNADQTSQLGQNLGGILAIILGIFAFAKMRWAFIALEVDYIIVGLLQSIGIVMLLFSGAISDVIINLLILAYMIVMVVFSHICQAALSESTQSLRHSYQEKRMKKSSVPVVEIINGEWVCTSCGERNPKNNSVCRGCGKYK
ncbi:MAG: zinc ribbon domain-containing protein [Clostridia bacterium]|nr:zinc ribbon domain-containing protein [Clostridia bacterium]